jgi:uncharacterized membrane protein
MALKRDEFYLISILLVITLIIITEFISLFNYFWIKTKAIEEKLIPDYYFSEYHPFLMATVLLINGFCKKSKLL